MSLGHANSLTSTMAAMPARASIRRPRRRIELELNKLREMRREAEEFGNAERIAEIEEIMEAMQQELSRSLRPDGTPRRAKSTAKRAYDAVRKTIRRAIAQS